jgi:integrase
LTRAAVHQTLRRGEWRNSAAAEIRLSEYGETWITERSGLRPRTIELYQWLLRKHIAPHLCTLRLADLDNNAPTIRAWRRTLLDAGVSATMTAKAYRLLHAILNIAVEDDTIRRNPCRIKGAGYEAAAERPTLTPAQVTALAVSVPPRFALLVLLATYASLRWGEVAGLRRMDVDTEAATVRVERALVELASGEVIIGPPKSRASRRTVSFPPALLPVVGRHLADYVGPEPDAPLFVGPRGALLQRSNFSKLTRWAENVAAVGARLGYGFMIFAIPATRSRPRCQGPRSGT